MRMRSAFTVIELMMVVAIIAGLSGMALPVVSAARSAALRVGCGSNLRQIAHVAIAYAGENEDCLPAAMNHGDDAPATSPAWFHRLPRFVGTRKADGAIFQCSAFHWHGAQRFANAAPKSLKMNRFLDWNPYPYSLGGWNDESLIMFFIDGIAGETGMGQWGQAYPSAVDDRRHHGTANVLFLDGHVQAVRLPKKGAWDQVVRWQHEAGGE